MRVDPLQCPKCGGIIKIVSFIEDDAVIEEILKHCGKWKVGIERSPPIPGTIVSVMVAKRTISGLQFATAVPQCVEFVLRTCYYMPCTVFDQNACDSCAAFFQGHLNAIAKLNIIPCKISSSLYIRRIIFSE